MRPPSPSQDLNHFAPPPLPCLHACACPPAWISILTWILTLTWIWISTLTLIWIWISNLALIWILILICRSWNLLTLYFICAATASVIYLQQQQQQLGKQQGKPGRQQPDQQLVEVDGEVDGDGHVARSSSLLPDACAVLFHMNCVVRTVWAVLFHRYQCNPPL